jgi:hypothetical protein
MLWESCLCILQLVASLRHDVPLNRKLAHRWACPYDCKPSMQRRGEFPRFSSLSNFLNPTNAILMLRPSLALSPLGLSEIYLAQATLHWWWNEYFWKNSTRPKSVFHSLSGILAIFFLAAQITIDPIILQRLNEAWSLQLDLSFVGTTTCLWCDELTNVPGYETDISLG